MTKTEIEFNAATTALAAERQIKIKSALKFLKNNGHADAALIIWQELNKDKFIDKLRKDLNI